MLYASPASAIPTLDHPVTDLTESLSQPDIERIAHAIVVSRDSGHANVAVLLINGTEGQPIGDYAHQIAATWNGGILITLDVQGHHSDIEVARNYQDEITDSDALHILQNARPLLRSDFPHGVFQITNDVIVRTGGPNTIWEDAPPPAQSSDADYTLVWVVLGSLLGAFFLVWIMSRTPRRRYFSGGYGGGYGGGYSSPSSVNVLDINVGGGEYSSSGSSGDFFSSGSSSDSYSDSSSSSDRDSSSSWNDSSSSGGFDGGGFDGGGGSSAW